MNPESHTSPHRHSPTVYALLTAVVLMAVVGLVYEHLRTIEREQRAMLDRAHDIAVAVSAVIRSESHFLRGIVWQPRLEAVLKELTDARDLRAVALFNTQNETVASAGDPIDLSMDGLSEQGYHWGKEVVTVLEFVALGQVNSGEDFPPIIVVGGERMEEFGGPGGPGGGPHDQREGDRPWDSGIGRGGPPRDFDEPGDEARRGPPPPPREFFGGSGRPGGDGRPDGDSGFRGDSRRIRFLPWWRLDEKEREALLAKEGVHGFVLALSATEYREKIARDLHLRLSLGAIALLAVLGMGFAWHNFTRSSELQLRLLRAGEMNLHLREMNLAAAGLAHETRNPLNIIRGLAQLISRQEGATDETRQRTGDITDEVDRVTNRLNQFIDYSRPPEPRPAPTDLRTVAADVARTLETDREDKGIRVDIEGPALTVQADESLLRQILFNLLLNAIQAVEEGGHIWITVERASREEAAVEVRDDGPGVPVDSLEAIFRPYHTGSTQGTGLGLAIVRQLVLAHHWDVACIPRPEGGACFRVAGIKLA